MKSLLRYLLRSASALSAFLLLVEVTHATAYKWTFETVNTTGKDANDLHLIFAGTGGTISNREILQQPAGAGQGTFGTGSNIDISWTGTVGHDTIKIGFETTVEPVLFASGYWTFKEENIGTVTITGRQPKIIPETGVGLFACLGAFGATIALGRVGGSCRASAQDPLRFSHSGCF